MQFSSFAVYMANQPRRFGVLRQANTSTGHTARQKPHALHMSSEMMTSHRPAGPRDGFLSALNSGISGSVPRQTPRGVQVMTAEHMSCASNLQRTPQATEEVKSWADDAV